MNCSNCNEIIDTSRSGFVLCPACGQVNMVSPTQVHNIPLEQRAPSIYSKRVFETPPPEIINRHKGPNKRVVILASVFVGVILILSSTVLGVSNLQASSNLKKARAEVNSFNFQKADEYLKMGDKLFALPNTKKQIKELNEQNQQWLSDAEILNEVEVLIEKKDYAKALEKLKEISKSYPDKDRITTLYSKVQNVLDAHALKSENIKPEKQSLPEKPVAQEPQQQVAPVASPCPVYSTINTRSATDRRDDYEGYQVHVIYAIPKDRTDRSMDVNGKITNSVNSFQSWLCGQSQGKHVRMDTFNGALDVSFARLSATDNELKTGVGLPWATNPQSNPYLLNDLDFKLEAMGFTNKKKIYAVYYDGTSNYSCGQGTWPPYVPGNIGAIYLSGRNPSWDAGISCEMNEIGTSVTTPSYPEYSMLHEITHSLGFVANCAPHANNSHTTDNNNDLMYTGPLPWLPSILDPGNDDYYNTKRTDCIDLANSAFLVGGGTALPPGW